jgi:predicted amidophosphoribosyltransferase
VDAPSLEAFEAGERESGRLCAVCQTAIALGEAVGRCPRCEAPYHRECWSENGGCAAYGCELAPQTVKAEEGAAPQTYWGQEEKDCPRCAQRIKVAALRCRHCGAVFDFAAGIVPCTAPFAFAFGGVWYLLRRRQIARLASTYRILALLGVVAAGAVTLVFTAAAGLHGAISLLSGP